MDERLRAVENCSATFEERFANEAISREYRAASFVSRIDRLAEEVDRQRDAQAHWVTIERVEAVEISQRLGRETLAETVDAKFTARADTNAGNIQALSDRLIEMEQIAQAREERWQRQSEERKQSSQRVNGWMIAGLGAAMSLVVIVVNIVTKGM